jgi:ArsR family transcriptional regulator
VGQLDNIFTKVNMTATLTTTNTLFRAFADETRLRLLNLLLERDVCVCHLCMALDVSQPNVSRHLAYLRRAGLVTARQEGRWMYYSVPNHPTGLHRTLLECVGTCLREIDVLQEDLARLAEASHSCEC